jgi:toxin ParE1/3/4
VRRVVVRPAAAADIEDAYEWYESRHAGLGDEFLAALQAVQDRLVEHPEAHPVVHRNTRRALIQRRFPYAFFYRIYGDTIVLVACMHVRRNPRRWQRRT